MTEREKAEVEKLVEEKIREIDSIFMAMGMSGDLEAWRVLVDASITKLAAETFREGEGCGANNAMH